MAGSVLSSPREDGTYPDKLNGRQLRSVFEAAERFFDRHRDVINSLNVFPVPDGDTGTNMLLTLRSVLEQGREETDASAGSVMASMARGAVLGARGNSGVILSQFFQGMARGLEEKEELDGRGLAACLELASRAAYASVGTPVEGTMLTVIDHLSRGASRHVADPEASVDLLSVWTAGLHAAREAVSNTPLQLQVLADAGVVDAGGQGVVTILEGARRCMAGQSLGGELDLCAPCLPSGGESAAPDAGVREEYLRTTEEELYGYCTQLLIEGSSLEVDEIRDRLGSMAGSTVVVGTSSLVRLHVHTHDPGPVISYAVSLGTVREANLQSMDEQHGEFLASHRGETRRPASGLASRGEGPAETAQDLAVVAVAWGDGFVDLFEDLGCSLVVVGGQTMNPSAGELMDAAAKTRASQVILLPDNSNVVPAARQAVSLAAEGGDGLAQSLSVLSTRSLPEGVAALLAFNASEDLERNLHSMETAISGMRSIEVTRAVRDSTFSGSVVREGQYIGLVDGDLVSVGESPHSVLQEALAGCAPEEGQLISLYRGEDVGEDEGEDAAESIRLRFPGVEVEQIYGGQPLYHYLASIE
ncbi:MAG: DAK2 domain-containing protein [Dehalococcoidia bacterium]|nr:DAK2 domain-containing protein [Dehalococcoidia bacterium]